MWRNTPSTRTRRDSRIKAIRQAVDDHFFSLVFQPIVAIDGGIVHHFEALTRFEKDVSPFDTIIVAEEIGAAPEFDLSVTREVLNIARNMANRGQRADIAVNISGHSIQDIAFVETLIAMLRASRPEGIGILIEVTESATIDDLSRVNEHIQILRQAGYPVCIDDFQTGAEVFNYLKAFEVDFVKIDGAFSQFITAKGVDRTIVHSMLELCHQRQVAIIAEHIETESQARLLAAAGVQYGQGYLFGRPTELPTAQ